MVPVIGADHATTTAFATETNTMSPGPPVSAPMPKQLASAARSASDRGLETQLTVSEDALLTIVVADHWSFSTCLWPPIVNYRPRYPMPPCKYPRNQSKTSL
jgi:hypothetical protein